MFKIFNLNTMRNLCLFLVMLLMLGGCRNEGELFPQLDLENLYKIEDNFSDSVSKKVYEIYEQYGVTVVFNDTIGKVFVKTDIYGDSVFTYETVDPAWSFTGYSETDYSYSYMEDPDSRLKMLRVVQQFLDGCSKTLYPQVILLLDSYTTTTSNGQVTNYENGNFLVTYRSLLLCASADNTVLESLPESIMRTFIIQRINDYASELALYHRVSKDYIGKSWEAIGAVNLKEPITYWENDPWAGEFERTITTFIEGPLYNSASCLQDDWWGFRDYDVELVEIFRKAVRELIGTYGFVSQSEEGAANCPPADEEEDLKLFVREMLRYSREEFEALWGEQPLVMQKYEILYELLENELGVKL